VKFNRRGQQDPDEPPERALAASPTPSGEALARPTTTVTLFELGGTTSSH